MRTEFYRLILSKGIDADVMCKRLQADGLFRGIRLGEMFISEWFVRCPVT